ncbi:MAG: hypothetical protein KC589_09945 [Nanoarchaeota archaeon]|nr:hypothetical protein [Nanoarchaeota archaeon]
MLIIRGILENEDIKNPIMFWFSKIDKIYFSNENYLIILSDLDKNVISKYKDAHDKLKILSFKKNIKIEGF